MWQRFSAYSIRVINYAQEETVKLGHDIVCTEHLLLGLIREPDCTAVKILLAMGVNTEQIRTEVEQQVTRGDKHPDQDIQLSVGAKKVIDIAMSEAKDMNSERVCSKHLLLGLIKKEDAVAGQVLHKLGADLDRTRNEAANIYDVEITEADTAFGEVKTKESRQNPLFEIPAMRNEAQEILKDIVEEYGALIYTDIERCKGLLWEVRGDYAREIIALQLVLQAGIVQELASLSNKDTFTIIDRLPRRATELTPIDWRCAAWAIVSWGKALGLIHGLKPEQD